MIPAFVGAIWRGLQTPIPTPSIFRYMFDSYGLALLLQGLAVIAQDLIHSASAVFTLVGWGRLGPGADEHLQGVLSNVPPTSFIPLDHIVGFAVLVAGFLLARRLVRWIVAEPARRATPA